MLRVENPAAGAVRAQILARSNGGAAPACRPGTMPHPFRTGMERRDIDAVVATLRADVVAFSPVTPHPFVGIEEVAGLLKNLIDGFEELEYSDEVTDGRLHAILFRGRVMGQVVTGVDVLRLDEDGRIRRIEVSARPPAGVFAMAARFSPMFARWRRGRMSAAVLRAMLRFAPAGVAAVDRFGSRLARAAEPGAAPRS
jgi:SnoaL-like domain